MSETAPGFPLSKEVQVGRVWTCKAEIEDCTRARPCNSCRGRRNRRSGLKKQRAARKALAVPDARFHGQLGNEENFGGAVRTEVKSGAIAGPVWTKHLASEAQSEGNRAIGDNRPFVGVFMPKGTSDGVVTIRLSTLRDAVAALAVQFFGQEAS